MHQEVKHHSPRNKENWATKQSKLTWQQYSDKKKHHNSIIMFSFYNAQNSRWYHVFCWSVSSHSRELARKPLDEKWQLNIIDKHIHIQISANEQPSTVELQRCSAPQLRPARAIWLSPLHAQTLTQRKRIPIRRLPSFQHRLKPAPAGRRCHQQGSAPTRCPNTDSSANKLTPITSRSRRSHLLTPAHQLPTAPSFDSAPTGRLPSILGTAASPSAQEQPRLLQPQEPREISVVGTAASRLSSWRTAAMADSSIPPATQDQRLTDSLPAWLPVARARQTPSSCAP
jgi:hypothetical protein